MKNCRSTKVLIHLFSLSASGDRKSNRKMKFNQYIKKKTLRKLILIHLQFYSKRKKDYKLHIDLSWVIEYIYKVFIFCFFVLISIFLLINLSISQDYLIIWILLWRIIALQNFVFFCQTSTWISQRYTYVPSLLNLLPSPFPSNLSRLIQSLCLSLRLFLCFFTYTFESLSTDTQ